MVDPERTKNIIGFVLSEKLISITVLGSIFTFTYHWNLYEVLQALI